MFNRIYSSCRLPPMYIVQSYFNNNCYLINCYSSLSDNNVPNIKKDADIKAAQKENISNSSESNKIPLSNSKHPNPHSQVGIESTLNFANETYHDFEKTLMTRL